MAELSTRDKNRIRKHVTNCCANYSKEYGCLPLETECYMFSVGFTDSKLCKYYEQAVLPTDAELYALFKGVPTRVCKQCGQPFNYTPYSRVFRHGYASNAVNRSPQSGRKPIALSNAPQKHAVGKRQNV